MSKEIKIDPLYNSVIFRVKRTPGDFVTRCFPSHGIFERTIPEGYYMNRKAPKKTNFIINIIKRMYTEMKGIIEVTKSEQPECIEDTANRKVTKI